MHHPYCSSCQSDHAYDIDCQGNKIASGVFNYFSDDIDAVNMHQHYSSKHGGRSLPVHGPEFRIEDMRDVCGFDAVVYNLCDTDHGGHACVTNCSGSPRIAARIAKKHYWPDYVWYATSRDLHVWET